MDTALMAKEVLNLPDIQLIHRPTVWTNLSPWRWEAERDYHNLWVGLAGEGSLDVDGASYRIAPGRAFLFAPGTRIKAQQTGKGAMVNFAAHFTLSKGRRLPAELVFLGLEVPRGAGLDLRLREIAARARWTDALAGREVQAMVFLVLAQLWRLHHQRYRPKAARLEALLEAIDAEPHRFSRVEQMVTFMNVSPAHLRRLLVEKVGRSPRQYLVARRIERAQMLLQTSTLNIAEVAHALGYEDAFYFSRQFKQICGLSPQHWRRRGQAAEGSA